MTLQVGVKVVQFEGTLGGDVVLNVKWGLFGEGERSSHGKEIFFQGAHRRRDV